MKRVFKGLMLCSAVIGLASCSNEEGFQYGGEEGKLLLELSSDGRVMMNTRADDTKVSVVPEPNQFGVVLEKQDGSLTKKYANIDAFNRESGFPIGTYTLSATYGDMENEGFELPYFAASQDVTVVAGTQNHVSLTATLANSMVSVRYSDEFTSRFPAYSARIKGENADDSHWVAFAQNEDRPAYVKPDVINLRISLTNEQGKQVEVAPGEFTASARHHYIVTIGVGESAGTEDVALKVDITEEVEYEFVEIALGDDLFNAPAPMLKLRDFPADLSYSDFEGFEAPGDPRLDVLAYGGLREVNLSVESSNTLPFGKSVQLVNADAGVQANVAASGLEADGFFRNPDKAGVIKFKDFLAKLPQGTYKVTVDATDNRTIVSEEPVSFNVTIKAVNIRLSVAKHPEFMDKELELNVITNQPDVKNKLRFQVKDAAANWVDAEILSAPAPVRATRAADDEYTFIYRLSIPAIEHKDVEVRAFYAQDTAPKCEIKDEGVIFPEYKVEVDPFAYKVLFKVTATDAAKQDIVLDNFVVSNNGKEVYPKLINKAEGIFEIDNLSPVSTYSSFKSYLGNTLNPSQQIETFSTENEKDLENGDFEINTQTINIGDLPVGGKYKIALNSYTIKSSINRSTPNGWANVNDKTCWTGSKNINSWFLVPSTYSENGQVVLQSVGYSHDGKTPDTTSGIYYSTHTPSQSELDKASGELFLGSYSFDGTEHRTDGVSWNCRPISLTFTYSYQSYNNEEGEAYVNVLDEAGNIIGKGKLSLPEGSNKNMTLKISDYIFGKKAAKLQLGFRSTKSDIIPAVHIPQDSELDEGITWKNFTNPPKKNANDYHAVALGSKLTIDNVKLEYGGSASQQAKRRPTTIKSVARK